MTQDSASVSILKLDCIRKPIMDVARERLEPILAAHGVALHQVRISLAERETTWQATAVWDVAEGSETP